METARKAFFEGIKYARVGYRIFDISEAVQNCVEAEGFSVVRDFVGHGIGRDMHEDPQIPNFVVFGQGRGMKLKPGMTLAIEPMITLGRYAVEFNEADGWTVSTRDGSYASHYENTILITDGEPEILTIR
jgi:methionyl aminopeptidase